MNDEIFDLGSIDWNAVEEMTPRDDVPAGEYAVNIVAAKLSRSKNGSPRVSVECRITEGNYRGAAMFRDFYLTPNALGIWKGACEALGGGPGDSASIIGKEGIAVVGVKEAYGDRPASTEIKWFKPPAGGANKPSQPSQPSSGMPSRIKFG